VIYLVSQVSSLRDPFPNKQASIASHLDRFNREFNYNQFVLFVLILSCSLKARTVRPHLSCLDSVQAKNFLQLESKVSSVTGIWFFCEIWNYSNMNMKGVHYFFKMRKVEVLHESSKTSLYTIFCTYLCKRRTKYQDFFIIITEWSWWDSEPGVRCVIYVMLPTESRYTSSQVPYIHM
jgi:hypothetical protein